MIVNWVTKILKKSPKVVEIIDFIPADFLYNRLPCSEKEARLLSYYYSHDIEFVSDPPFWKKAIIRTKSGKVPTIKHLDGLTYESGKFLP